MAEQTLTAAEVARRLDVKVRMPKVKDGKPVYDARQGRYQTVERAPRAEDVLAFKDYGGRIVAVTADGRKVEARRQ